MKLIFWRWPLDRPGDTLGIATLTRLTAGTKQRWRDVARTASARMGFIEETFVNYMGQAVKHGQPDSPDLVATQEERCGLSEHGITPGASRPIWRAPHLRRDPDRWLVRESRPP